MLIVSEKLIGVAICLALLVLGVSVGLMVGLSASPVVGVVVPLLMSVAIGSGGFYFANGKLDTLDGRALVLFVSLSIISLSVGSVAGVMLGIQERTKIHAWSLVSSDSEDEFPPAAATELEAIGWLLLEEKLYRLGLDRVQRMALLKRFDKPKTPLDKKTIAASVDKVSKLYDKAMPELAALEYAEDWRAFGGEVAAANEYFSKSSNPDVPKPMLLLLRRLAEQVVKLDDDEDDQSELQSKPGASAALASLKLELALLMNQIGDEDNVQLANDLLNTVVGDVASARSIFRSLASDQQGDFVPSG